MTCLGVLDRGERGDDNETSLKEGGLIEMSTTVLHSRCSLFRLNTYLVYIWFNIFFDVSNKQGHRVAIFFQPTFVHYFLLQKHWWTRHVHDPSRKIGGSPRSTIGIQHVLELQRCFVVVPESGSIKMYKKKWHIEQM